MSEARVATADETAALGAALARSASPPCVIGIEGPLGAGKTTLVRGFLHALGYGGPVRSPSYTLLESYPLAGATVHHLDLYRLFDPEELEQLGVRDLAAADAVWLIEWPERGAGFLPPLSWCIRIDCEADGKRRVSGLPDQLVAPDDS